MQLGNNATFLLIPNVILMQIDISSCLVDIIILFPGKSTQRHGRPIDIA